MRQNIHMANAVLLDIDAQVSQDERSQIAKAIAAELPKGYRTRTHPSLPPLFQPNFTPMMQAEIDRKARGALLEGGIDMSRYEAPDEPVNGNDSEWREALQAAYQSSTYLDGRQVNLSLLEEYGKNAWLIGNSQLEEMLQQAEKELAALKDETDNINKARKGAQEESRGELVALEESWKLGVGKLIEVQIASDSLRKEILKWHRRH